MGEHWRNGAKLPWELATVGPTSQDESMWGACSSACGVYLSFTYAAVVDGQIAVTHQFQAALP
ncbi:hypothetical protein [uncultured Actinomyces sp.]|uniref:hypothetical protein n=1 Tax=uncultured Actinomyces sp. TaxID=249061 RepID=UPI002638283E|nr:hypothetical protein [uncultured Actinomyces sp.]